MSERVRGGWEGEKTPRVFDTAQTFDQILGLIINAQPGAFKNSAGRDISAPDIVAIKTLAEGGNLATKTMVNLITKNYGLREAVVRAMAPRFDQMQQLTQIYAWLNYAKNQEVELGGLYGENEKPLNILFDSSENPVVITTAMQNLEYVIDFVRQYPGAEMPNGEVFLSRFTSKYGLRDAIKKAFTIARSGGML